MICIQYTFLFIVSAAAATIWRDKYREVIITGMEFVGILEVVLGMLQLFGIASRRHGLFAMTGTFSNPGPFGGFVAMVAVISLADYIQNKRGVNFRKWLSFTSLTLCLIALVVSLSRAAWISFFLAGTVILARNVYVRNFFAASSWRLPVAIIVAIICLTAAIGMKKDSAAGRLHIWHMEARAIAEKPLTGYGLGNELGAYGSAQHDYFTSGCGNDIEKTVAGSPEYAFNEYLKAAEAGGIGLLIVVLSILLLSIYFLRGSPLQLGLISLAVFSFASYPLSLPEFRICLTLMLGASLGRITKPFWKPLIIVLLGAVTVYAIMNYSAAKEYYAAKKAAEGLSLSSINQYYPGLEDELGKYNAILGEDYHFLYEYGWAMYKAGKHQESNAILAKGIKKSSDPMFYNVMGINYWAMGDYEQASSCFTYASFMVPSRLYPHILQMQMALDFGETDDARRIAQSILSMPINPKNTDMVVLRDRAKHVLDTLMKENP